MAPRQTCACEQADCRTCMARRRKQLQREREKLVKTQQESPKKT